MRKSFGHYNTAPKKEYLYEKKCIRSGNRSLGESADQELERKGPGSEPHLRHLPSTIVDKRPPSARVSALLVTEQGCGKHFARAEAVRMCARHIRLKISVHASQRPLLSAQAAATPCPQAKLSETG